MRRRTKALIVAAGLAAVAVAVPWLVPVARFIPAIEARASERLGEPVRIASLRLALLPLPHLVAKGVTVGGVTAGGVTAGGVSVSAAAPAGKTPLAEIGRVVVRPSLLHLLAETLVVREIRLERVVVQQDLLPRLAALRGSGAQPPRARVQRVVIQDAILQLRGATLRDLAGEILLDTDGKPREIRASMDGGRLRAIARPDANGALALEITARAWTPPAGPRILFDRIDAKALLSRHGIDTRDVQASLYGGRVNGPVSVRWTPGWAIEGEVTVKSVNLQPLVALFVRGHALSGQIDGAPRFSLRARRARDLLANLELASDFTIKDGLLHKIDLVAAAKNPFARRPSSTPSTDGQQRNTDQVAQTRFDELAGHLTIDRDGYHFSDLEVASGLLRANGELSIARDRTLDGRIDAEVRGTASLLTVPLNVSGTIQEPVVQPTRTAMAAALAGSVLLPGIGTAIGLKASQLTDRLFSGRKKREGRAK